MSALGVFIIHVVLLDSQSSSEGYVECLALQYPRPWRNTVCEPDVSSNHRVVPNGDASKDGGIGIYGDMITYNWVSRHIDRPSVVIDLKVFGT